VYRVAGEKFAWESEECRIAAEVTDALGPFLRPVQNANYVDGITGDSINHDVGQGRKHQFPRSLFFAGPPAMGQLQERGWAL